MFFFSRFISVVPSRLTWDGLSSWGLNRGVGMGQEEEDLPQPDPLCRHLRVSVLACLPVSCETILLLCYLDKPAASNCICMSYVYAYILLCVQCYFRCLLDVV